MKFAEGTSVPVSRSLDEIEKLLLKAGAQQYGIGLAPGGASVTCVLDGRTLRFLLPLPTAESVVATLRETPRYRWSTPPASLVASKVEQETMRRWRCLTLAIKAKLEVVATGIETFEKAFLANIVLPNKQTVGEWLGPQITEAYEGGAMPLALGPVVSP